MCANECTIVRPEVEGEVTLLYVQLLGAGFYMLIGMAILSMCFSLIQEEMLIKVVLIANLCGCNKKPDEHTAQRIAHEKQQQQVRTYTLLNVHNSSFTRGAYSRFLLNVYSNKNHRLAGVHFLNTGVHLASRDAYSMYSFSPLSLGVAAKMSSIC